MKLTWRTITGTPENIIRTEHNNLHEAIEHVSKSRKNKGLGLEHSNTL